MPEQPETKLQRKIVKALNDLPGCKFQKVHGTPFGSPTVDLTGAVCGRRAEIEVKMPGKEPTKRQYKTLSDWESVGCITGWATSVEEAINIVTPYLEKQ